MGKPQIKCHIQVSNFPEKYLNHLAKFQISNPHFSSNPKSFQLNLKSNIKSFMKMNVQIDFQEEAVEPT